MSFLLQQEKNNQILTVSLSKELKNKKLCLTRKQKNTTITM